MDINEPPLMDVAHDTINSTRRSGANRSRLRLAKVPGQGFFVVIVGGSHEISSMPAVGIKRGSKDHSIH